MEEYHSIIDAENITQFSHVYVKNMKLKVIFVPYLFSTIHMEIKWWKNILAAYEEAIYTYP